MNTEIFFKEGDDLVLAGRWEWAPDAERAFKQAKAMGAAKFTCNALPSQRLLRAGGAREPGAPVKTLRFEIWHEPSGPQDNVVLVAEDAATLATLREDEGFKAAA